MAVLSLMEVIPAIDLRGGQCVRLQQGDYDRETVFGSDPVAMARRWALEGATRLHLVDLDGAKSGQPVNRDVVRRILEAIPIPCQLGGGIRSDVTAEDWLAAGLDRVIVGTQALKDPAWFGALARRHPGRVVLGLDARDGKVATEGWYEVSSVDALDLALQFDELPLAALIYTDIARDGMMQGPNVAATAALARRLRTPVIASGGISALDDLTALAAIPVPACIAGRSLYEGAFSLPQALARLNSGG